MDRKKAEKKKRSDIEDGMKKARIAKCTACGAECTEKKDEKRFRRRHRNNACLGAKRRAYNVRLAEGLRSAEDREIYEPGEIRTR